MSDTERLDWLLDYLPFDRETLDACIANDGTLEYEDTPTLWWQTPEQKAAAEAERIRRRDNPTEWERYLDDMMRTTQETIVASLDLTRESQATVLGHFMPALPRNHGKTAYFRIIRED